jgi:hypothetical protein
MIRRTPLLFRFSVLLVLPAAIAAGCSSGDPAHPTDGTDMSSATSESSSSSGTASSSSHTSAGTASSSSTRNGSTSTNGSSTDDTSGTSSSVPTQTNSGAVSFANDVLAPIFKVSCSAMGSSCHGDPSVATGTVLKRPYLGPGSSTANSQTIATIIAGLMKSSAEDPSMPLVTPGDATKSYLMHKMDNTQGTLDCSAGDDGGDCGAFMPNMAIAILSQTKRDTVRAWINEGAPNN